MKRLIAAFAPPALAIALFYALVPTGLAAGAAARGFAASWQSAAALLTAPLPFSVMEVLAAVLILWLLYVLGRLILPGSKKRAVKRLITYVAVLCYGVAAFLWVWSPAYFAPPLYDGVLTRGGITVAQLQKTAEAFRDDANALADSVPRDANGSFAVDTDEVLWLSAGLYNGLVAEFPKLRITEAKPKPLLISAFMSRTGYTGIYFALTGEPNVNITSPRALLPSTVAHELAHAYGVAREDAANFFGIAACVTSDTNIYRYSGYLDGLLLLGNALYAADSAAYYELAEGYSDSVRQDLRDNSAYWAEIVERNAKSPAMEAVSTAVNSTYDTFMRSNGQENGLKTYGECIDLLVEWHLNRQI